MNSMEGTRVRVSRHNGTTLMATVPSAIVQPSSPPSSVCQWYVTSHFFLYLFYSSLSVTLTLLSSDPIIFLSLPPVNYKRKKFWVLVYYYYEQWIQLTEQNIWTKSINNRKKKIKIWNLIKRFKLKNTQFADCTTEGTLNSSAESLSRFRTAKMEYLRSWVTQK